MFTRTLPGDCLLAMIYVKSRRPFPEVEIHKSDFDEIHAVHLLLFYAFHSGS